MKRRTFLATAATGAAAVGVAAPAIAQGIRQLNLISVWSRKLPGLGNGALRLARRITAASDGQLEVRVFAAGELVPAFESFDAVAGGRADMYYGAEDFWQNKSPAYGFFAGVPFGLTANEHLSWIREGGGQELWDELSAQHNIKPFLVGDLGGQMGGWFLSEVEDVAALDGLQVSAPPLLSETLSRLGASAAPLPLISVFPAMQSKFIDGAVGMGPWIDLSFGLYQTASNYYTPGLHAASAPLSFGINRAVWDNLSETHQAVVHMAASSEYVAMFSEFAARNAVALRALRRQHGVTIRPFPKDVLNAVGENAGQVVAEVGQVDPLSTRVYESFLEFRRNAISWSRLTDHAFVSARSLPFRYGAS